MKTLGMLLAVGITLSLAACGGSDSATPPGAPTGVSVARGAAAGQAVVSFTAPASSGSSAITGYTVTVNPGSHTATGTSSPITVTGLAAQTAYTYSVVATSADGASAAAATGALRFYSVVETFHEPMTQPNDSIFTGTFTFDTTSKAVSNLQGSLTQSMVGPPMTEVALTHQLSSVAVTLGGVDGLLVTTFALSTTVTFDNLVADPTGFAPGPNAAQMKAPGTGNAYAMIFVNRADPAVALVKAQLDKLAYADCTPDGMMGMMCMTGTSMDGYGAMGTMDGVPESQVVTEL